MRGARNVSKPASKNVGLYLSAEDLVNIAAFLKTLSAPMSTPEKWL